MCLFSTEQGLVHTVCPHSFGCSYDMCTRTTVVLAYAITEATEKPRKAAKAARPRLHRTENPWCPHCCRCCCGCRVLESGGSYHDTGGRSHYTDSTAGIFKCHRQQHSWRHTQPPELLRHPRRPKPSLLPPVARWRQSPQRRIPQIQQRQQQQ